MHILSSEFFLELGSLAEAMEARSTGRVIDDDVSMLLECIDAAMGMVYELEQVTWADGHPVPAYAIAAMRNHVISDPYWSSEEAMRISNDLYEAVTNRAMRDE